MITAILETKDGEVIGRCGRAGNEHYLIRREPHFTKLSLLSEIDYDVFTKSDMAEMISELMALRKAVSKQDQLHVNEIMKMAVRCRDEDGLTLTFTPFD